MPPDVSVVLPTYNRLGVLQNTLKTLLDMPEVLEVVVVDDGSTDGTSQALAEYPDPRVVHLKLPRNAGSTVARNAGLEIVRGEYVLMADDDVKLPPNYIGLLRTESQRLDADVVSAPWVFTWGKPVQEAVQEARARAVERVTLNSHPNTFTKEPVLTPFLPPMALVRRAVLAAGVRYDTRYTYNSWREETSFFVTAAERGFACWLTPATYSFQEERHNGGQPRQPFRYEYHAIRNNWIFLRKHRQYLREHGGIARSVPAQTVFAARRLLRLVRVLAVTVKRRGR